jgi:hypothetical protein
VRRPRLILIVAAVFVLAALLFGGQLLLDARYSGHPLRLGQALVLASAGWLGWLLLAPLVIWLA